jgi:Flp pilus assembly protein TadD
VIQGKTVLVALAAAAMITGCSSRQDLQNSYEASQQAAKQGDFKAAAADMTPIVQADSNDPSAYLAQAYACVNAGEDDRAIQDVSRAIDLEPQAASYIGIRSQLYTRVGRFDLALDDANTVVNLAPHTADSYSNRGYIYMTRGNSDLALVDFSQAIKLDPNVALFHLQKGFAYGMQQRYADAEREWKAALELRTEYGPAYSALGWLQATCPDPAFRNATEAVENSKRGAQLGAPNMLAAIAAASGLTPASTKPTHYEPGLAWSLDALAAAYAEAGDFDQAVAVQGQAIAHNNTAPNPLATKEQALLALYQQRKPYRADLSSIVPQLPWIVVPS